MKPAELYFEPVLIGLATLFIAGLLGLPALESRLLGAGAGEVAAAVATAYFVGIVVDRVSDAMLDPINHRHRLLFARKEPRVDAAGKRCDPFPEDAYHVATLGSEQASDYVHYLRSRIRLMRAMLVLAPACGVGFAVRLSQEGSLTRAGAIAVVCVTYGLAIILRCREASVLAMPERFRKNGSVTLRTDRLAEVKVLAWYDERFPPRQALWKFAIRNEPLSIPAAALAVYAGLVAGSAARSQVGVLAAIVYGLLHTVGTLFITAVLAWCWWRITHTYFTFLRNYSKRTGSIEARSSL
jgi:hypothetical protein